MPAFWKPQHWPQDRKRSVFISVPKKAMPKNAQTTAQLHSSHSLINEVKSPSCVRLCDPMDCSLPETSVHGIFQARLLEWVAISFSRVSSWPRDRTPGLLHCRQTLQHLSYQGSPLTSKAMLKILQARLQQYVSHELPDVQAGDFQRQINQRSNCQHPLNH